LAFGWSQRDVDWERRPTVVGTGVMARRGHGSVEGVAIFKIVKVSAVSRLSRVDMMVANCLDLDIRWLRSNMGSTATCGVDGTELLRGGATAGWIERVEWRGHDHAAGRETKRCLRFG
jgi:hypothetical protein